MPEYAWMCLNKQDSENATGPKYDKILNDKMFNMAVFITQRSQYEYTLTEFRIYLGF